MTDHNSTKLPTTGLIIGSFQPVHAGHVALIRFGSARCDRLVVAVCDLPGDEIPGSLRVQWIQTILQEDPSVVVEIISEDLPRSSVSSREVSRVWATYLQQRFPEVSVIFSSEQYGKYLAEYMGIIHEAFDPPRHQVPISGTAIRNHPLRHWDYIPSVVRPHFVKLVCIYGPESTGKTTLTRDLAAYFDTTPVFEMAREVLGDRHCVLADIPTIAKLHACTIIDSKKTANKVLIVDTDFITTQIYSQVYFREVPKVVYDLQAQIAFDLYLFLDIDVPWFADPQRDLGERRVEMRDIFQYELDRRELSYVTIDGSWSDRFARAKQVIEQLIED